MGVCGDDVTTVSSTVTKRAILSSHIHKKKKEKKKKTKTKTKSSQSMKELDWNGGSLLQGHFVVGVGLDRVTKKTNQHDVDTTILMVAPLKKFINFSIPFDSISVFVDWGGCELWHMGKCFPWEASFSQDTFWDTEFINYDNGIKSSPLIFWMSFGRNNISPINLKVHVHLVKKDTGYSFPCISFAAFEHVTNYAMFHASLTWCTETELFALMKCCLDWFQMHPSWKVDALSLYEQVHHCFLSKDDWSSI